MKALYFDRSTGITGDMLVGALCALGVKPSALEWELSKVEIGDFHMHFEQKSVGGKEGIRFTIHEGSTHTHEQDEDEDGHSHEGHEHGHGHTHVHADGTVCHHDHSHKEEHTHGEHEQEHAHAHAHGNEHEEHSHGHESAHAQGEHEEDGHHHHDHAPSRSLANVQQLIAASDLSPFVKEHAASILTRLSDTQGIDLGPIAEVICTCVGLEALGVDSFYIPTEPAGSTEGQIGDAIVAEFARVESSPAGAHGKVAYGAGGQGSPALLQATFCDLVED
jgi:uncharacterized protein (DUF111 family)